MGKSTLATTLAREEDKILACVHCGLCLEACPTYVATSDENDGPRGRIYLMRAVEEGRLANTSTAFERHIDRCLGCRACEAVCPAGVEYGQLLEAARAELRQAGARSGLVCLLLRFTLRHLWLKPKRLSKAFALARFLRDKGVAGFLVKSSFARGISPQFEFALMLLETSKRPDAGPTRLTRAGRMPANRPQDVGAPMDAGAPKYAGALMDNRERITLTVGETETTRERALIFKGCVTDGLFRSVNDATGRVLKTNGCEASVPSAQVCCGALHAHAGDLEGARQLARRNIEAFAPQSDETGAPPIVTNAGGCGAMLVSYPNLLANDKHYAQRAGEFSARVRDVAQQLVATGFRNGATIGSERTTYDTSCHLLHGQHAANASLQMLWAIPSLNFVILKDSDVCCGGAGIYNLLEPELSSVVLDEKLKHIEATGATVVATGNPGCQMQIAAGARLAGMELRVCHPVELLDESYHRAGFYD
jgi:glycolate dehydrogenase iron-sulfur subunit